jgi:hypothetical protein
MSRKVMSPCVLASSCARACRISFCVCVRAEARREKLAASKKRWMTVRPSSGNRRVAARIRSRRSRHLSATVRPVSYVIAEDRTPMATNGDAACSTLMQGISYTGKLAARTARHARTANFSFSFFLCITCREWSRRPDQTLCLCGMLGHAPYLAPHRY